MKGISLFSLLFLMALPCKGWAEEENLLINGNFEQGTDWPDGWLQPKGGTFEKDGTNHFVRLTSPSPGTPVTLYTAYSVEGGKAYELSYRVRVENIKPGKELWFDARIITNIKDASGEAFPSPAPVYFREDTGKWVEKKIKFKIPENATKLEIIAGLFQVESGTMDIDDIVLKSINPNTVK